MGLFGKKKCCSCSSEVKVEKNACCSGDEGKCTIKVLGSGCKKCHQLYENVLEAVKKIGIELDVEYVTDMEKIAEYGVMSMPALIICEKVVSMGSLLSTSQVEKILENYK